jgi:hypothetical protein
LPASAAGAQDSGGYQLSYLAGRWAAETQLIRQPIHQGEFVLESRKGHTNHYTNPWFAIDDGATSEETGPVWFGALGWSGNWRITVEQTAYRQVRVTGGFNSFDFAYPLASGESLDTPLFYGGFSRDGYGGASRLLHRFERERIYCPADSSRGFARCSTTPGRPPRSTSQKPARWPWRTKRPGSASNFSSSTTAGSARATTTMPDWAIGW